MKANGPFAASAVSPVMQERLDSLVAALPIRLRTEFLTFVCPLACILFLSASMMLTTFGRLALLSLDLDLWRTLLDLRLNEFVYRFGIFVRHLLRLELA